MLYSSNELLDKYQRETRDYSNGNSVLGKERISYYYLHILELIGGNVTERVKTYNLADGVRQYYMPIDYIAIKELWAEIGGQKYRLEPVIPLSHWFHRVQTTVEGSIPYEFTVVNDNGNVYVEVDPVPNDDTDDGLIIYYEGYLEPLTFPTDYTTGTVAIAAGATAVTGTGTTFAASHIGRFIKPTGAKWWYEIGAVGSGTGLTLTRFYDEPAVSGANYAIAEVPRLPAGFSMSPVWGAVRDYFQPTNEEKSLLFGARYDRDVAFIEARHKRTTTGSVTPGRPVSGRSAWAHRFYPKSPLTAS